MFFGKIFAYMEKKQYFCIVFFMVLDLRLMKIGLSGDNPSFFLSKFNYSQKDLQIPNIFRNFACFLVSR